MRLIFLLIPIILLMGCTKEIVYVDRVIYMYPDDAHLLDNGKVSLIAPEAYDALSVDDKLDYTNGLIVEYQSNYSMCLADKRAIKKWMMESKANHEESSTGQK